jgi:hypothetical protein
MLPSSYHRITRYLVSQGFTSAWTVAYLFHITYTTLEQLLSIARQLIIENISRTRRNLAHLLYINAWFLQLRIVVPRSLKDTFLC